MATTKKPKPKDKLLKVKTVVHQRIKVNAARAGKTMNDYIDGRTRD